MTHCIITRNHFVSVVIIPTQIEWTIFNLVKMTAVILEVTINFLIINGVVHFLLQI